MQNDAFYYYLHGTINESAEIIEDIFNNGLVSYRGNSMHSTMFPISEDDLVKIGLSDLMKSYTGGSFNTTFLIKVPKLYMARVLHRGGKLDFPIPMWKDVEGKDYYERKIAVFTPHLIQGAYNKTTNVFLDNPNYFPTYNPSGLQYSEEIITELRNWGSVTAEITNFSKERNNYSFQSLYKSDCEKNLWQSLMSYYSKKIPKRKSAHHKFDSNYYKQLLESKKR